MAFAVLSYHSLFWSHRDICLYFRKEFKAEMILHEYFSYSSVPLKQVYNSHINWDPKKLEEKDICTWAKESLVMWCGIRDRYISERLTHLVFCVFIQRWNVCLWFLIPFISAFCLVDTSLTLLSCSLRLEFSPVHRSMWVFPTWVRLLPVHMARPVAFTVLLKTTLLCL